MMSNVSASVEVKPVDERCRYWAKVFRAGTSLPLPEIVRGGSDLPGQFLLCGEEELFPGDVLIEGEETHHTKNRGWAYYVVFMDSAGELVSVRPRPDHKAKAKANGLPPQYLTGSGELAAAVRLAHAVQMGINFL